MLDYSGLRSYAYAKWFEHSVENKNQVLAVDFSRKGTLTESEKALLRPSIADFQRGEASEGKHLLAASKRFVRTAGLPAWASFHKLFRADDYNSQRLFRDCMQIFEQSISEAKVLRPRDH